MFQIRTDLAVETSEKRPDGKEVSGIRVEKKKRGEDVVITKVCIDTQKAAKTLGKPRGTYVSIEADQMMEEDSGYHREISEIFSEQLKTFLPKDYRNAKILVIGLGNREVTPDALGPKVIDHLFITRHLLEEFGKYLVELDQCCSISGIVPGVMAQTGMETVEILRGIVAETKPDLVISIHQNSYHQEEIFGGQVFYYQGSEKGKCLAEILQKRFDYVLGEKNRRLAKPNSNYYLLLHVKAPIVIVECGFLSNWKEAALLNTPEYQDRLAWTIHMGVMEYLNER